MVANSADDDLCLPQPPSLSPETTRALKASYSSRIPMRSERSAGNERALAKSLSHIPQYQIPWSKASDTANTKDTTRESDTRTKESPCKPTIPVPDSADPTPTKHEARTQKAQLEEALEQIKTLQHENQRLLANKLASGKQLDAVTRANENLQNELTAARKEHFTSIREHINKAAELEECQQRLNEMAASSKASSATSEIYTRGLATSVATRMAAAREKEEMTLALQQKNQALQAMEEIVNELQGELQALQADQELSLSQVQQLQDKLAGKATSVSKLRKDLQASQAELQHREQLISQQLHDVNTEHATAIQALHAEMEAQRQQHSVAAAERAAQQEAHWAALVSEHATHTASMEQQLQLLQEQKAGLDAQVQQQCHQAAQLTQVVQQHTANIAQLEEQLQACDIQITGLEAQLQSQCTQISGLEGQLQGQVTETTGLQARLQTQGVQITDLEAQLQAEGKAASESEQQLQARLQVLEAQLGSSNAAAAELRAQLTQMDALKQAEISALKVAKDEDLEAQAGQHMAQIEAMTSKSALELNTVLAEQERLHKEQLEVKLAEAQALHQEEMRALKATQEASIRDIVAKESAARNHTLEAQVEDMRSKWLMSLRLIKTMEVEKSRKKSSFGCFGSQGFSGLGA